MKKLFVLFCVLCLFLTLVGLSSAVDLKPGGFGVKLSDVSFFDYNHPSLPGGLPLHPLQNPTQQSGNVWGIISLTGVHTLIDNNPENNNLSGVAYYNSGSDGKYYFGVYGGLTLMSHTGTLPGQQRLTATAEGAFFRIYEVDATYMNVYDSAMASGPNVSGQGAFGTFALEIIYGPDKTPGTADDPVLWLDAVFSPSTLMYYDAAYQNGELEVVTQSSSVTGNGEAYLIAVGGKIYDQLQKGVFPIADPTLPFRADLKIISDLTADYDQVAGWRSNWTTTSQDPLTGAGQIPNPCIDLIKEVSPDGTNWYDANSETCDDAPITPDPAYYRLTIKNCGTEDLTNLVINDAVLGISGYNVGSNLPAGGPDIVLTSAQIPALSNPDLCPLDPAAHQLVNGGLRNIARVDAEGVTSGTAVSDEDPACIKCTPPSCGDGIVGNTTGETCDPPGSVPNQTYPSNTCRDNCTYCGDGIVNNGELCDFNAPGATNCSTSCTVLSYCGDGIVGNTTGETCDPPGSTQSNGNVCRADCTYCGDGITQTGESCDPTNPNDPITAAGHCSPTCTVLPYCGDGILDAGEHCDGSLFEPTAPPTHGSCRTDCTYCGDGIVNNGEQCDDGNAIDTDSCHNDCTSTPPCLDIDKQISVNCIFFEKEEEHCGCDEPKDDYCGKYGDDEKYCGRVVSKSEFCGEREYEKSHCDSYGSKESYCGKYDYHDCDYCKSDEGKEDFCKNLCVPIWRDVASLSVRDCNDTGYCDYNHDGKCDYGDKNYCYYHKDDCDGQDHNYCDYNHDGRCDDYDKNICDSNHDGKCDYRDKESCYSGSGSYSKIISSYFGTSGSFGSWLNSWFGSWSGGWSGGHDGSSCGNYEQCDYNHDGKCDYGDKNYCDYHKDDCDEHDYEHNNDYGVKGAMYRIIVTNCGSVDQTNVTINDPDLGITNYSVGNLAAGASVTLTSKEISELQTTNQCCEAGEFPNTACAKSSATEVCDTATLICGCQTDVDCDDHNACNGTETCDVATFTCKPGTPKNCSDGNFCTSDTCDPKTGDCLHEQKGCNDWNACTADSCNPATGGCVHNPIANCCTCDSNCNDNNACTTDKCVSGQCTHTPKSVGTLCNDANSCTTNDKCNAAAQCVGTKILSCCTCDKDCNSGSYTTKYCDSYSRTCRQR